MSTLSYKDERRPRGEIKTIAQFYNFSHLEPNFYADGIKLEYLIRELVSNLITPIAKKSSQTFTDNNQLKDQFRIHFTKSEIERIKIHNKIDRVRDILQTS